MEIEVDFPELPGGCPFDVHGPDRPAKRQWRRDSTLTLESFSLACHLRRILCTGLRKTRGISMDSIRRPSAWRCRHQMIRTITVDIRFG
jgi:hypothetical protein